MSPSPRKKASASDDTAVTFSYRLPPVGKGGGVEVVLPAKLHAAWGGVRARIPVVGTADGHPVQTSFTPMAGRHLFPFNKAMQAATGKGPGDTVTFVLRRDTGPRTIAPPPDLAAGLKRDARARAFWETLSFTARKEYVRWLEDAKRPETRTRRAAEALVLLRAGKKR